MSDITIPPYLLAYLPIVAIVLAVLAFVAISLPLAKKPIAGTTLRRQSIIAILAGVAATYHKGMAGWELLTILFVVAAFTAVYYRNHLSRKQNAQAIAAEKEATRKAQLESFLQEVKEETIPSE